jgi:hypothetical protein
MCSHTRLRMRRLSRRCMLSCHVTDTSEHAALHAPRVQGARQGWPGLLSDRAQRGGRGSRLPLQACAQWQGEVVLSHTHGQ